MTASEGFNHEQRIVIALLAATGTPNPERVVAADRVTAAKLGAALMPIFETLTDSLAGILASVSDTLDVLEEVTVEAVAEEVRAGLDQIEAEPSDE